MALAKLRDPRVKREEEAGDVRERGIPRHGRDGRPKVFSEDGKGEWYTRTTTFIDVLSDKSALTNWKLRTVLKGLNRDASALEAYGALEDPEGVDKGTVDKLVSRVLDVADGGLKAELGTALHDITEAIDEGRDPGFIPPEFEADIEAYRQATADIEVLGVETFCVLDEYRVAGTFDRLIRVSGDVAEMVGVEDGTIMVADIKTGSIDYDLGKIAMQLAAYRSMQRYNPGTFERSPLEVDGQAPSDKWGLIIHLPSGQGVCSLVPVDIAKGHEGLALSASVREWRRYWGRKASRREAIRIVSAA